MPFLVKYLQDIPKNCSECPCSVHITSTEIYCNARQKHFVVCNERPEECNMIDCEEEKTNNTLKDILDKIKTNDLNKKEADPSKYHICLNCIFNNGEAMHNKIICGYFKKSDTIYKNEFDTCVNWFYKGDK